MRCGICGQESTTTHACNIATGLTPTNPGLAQQYNALRHPAPQQQPDYAEFGKACVKILRGPLGGANACINAVTLLLVASKNFGIDLRSEA